MEWFIFALASAILTAIVSVINKKMLFKEHATEFSATLAVMTFVVSLPMLYMVDFGISLELYLWLFVSAVFASIGFLFVTKAVRHMELSLASPLLNFGPGFTAVLAVLILGEILSIMDVAGILMLMAGAYILEIDFHSHSVLSPFKKLYKSKYIHYIFLALGSYSVSAITGKYVLDFTTPITLVLIEQFFVVVIFLTILHIRYDGLRGVKHGIKTAGKLLLIVAVLTVSYRLLQATAISMTFVSLVIPIKRLSTLFATLLGGEVFREHGIYHKILACSVMIVGASLIIIG